MTIVACVALVGGTTPATAKPESKHPPRWDEQLRPLARFVEKTRELDFDHPVAVRFMGNAAFDRAFGEDAFPAEQRNSEAALSDALFALGLTDRRINVRKIAEQDIGSIAGFYDIDREELVVRGKDLDDIYVKATVVHELTHALQDQHFDLDRLQNRATNESEGYVLQFLIEGDATVVETAFVDTLSAAHQDAYYSGFGEGFDASWPGALQALASAPYGLGEDYVNALDQFGGTTFRNDAFVRPPKTEELLVDPVALEERQVAVSVPKPKLVPGEKKLRGAEPLGVITLYLMLASRLDPRTALEAVTGWGGDQSLSLTRRGKVCVRTNATGDSTADTDQLEAALTRWQAAMPKDAVTVSRDGNLVSFTACQASGGRAPGADRFTSVYTILDNRMVATLSFADLGIVTDEARCVGDTVLTDPEMIAIDEAARAADLAEFTEEQSAVADDVTTRAFEACGVEDPLGGRPAPGGP